MTANTVDYFYICKLHTIDNKKLLNINNDLHCLAQILLMSKYHSTTQGNIMKIYKLASIALTVAALGFSVGPANASLVLLSPIDFGGSGLGAVNTILTIQNKNTETGSVGREVGNPDDVITGDAKIGNSQTQTRTLSDLGITSANNLLVVFNAAEPDKEQSINLTNLQLLIFNPNGGLLFNSGLFTSTSFPNTFSGTGNSGFVFGLDAAGVAAAQIAAFGAGFGNNRVGLAATATETAGGNETFFVANRPGSGTKIPEPETMALFGIGLLALAVSRRRRS